MRNLSEPKHAIQNASNRVKQRPFGRGIHSGSGPSSPLDDMQNNKKTWKKSREAEEASHKILFNVLFAYFLWIPSRNGFHQRGGRTSLEVLRPRKESRNVGNKVINFTICYNFDAITIALYSKNILRRVRCGTIASEKG